MMKISCIQMNMRLGDPAYNICHAEELVRRAAEQEQPDVIVLPEMWNVGFFPREHLDKLADEDAAATRAQFSRLAKEYQINIVAGSVANKREECIFNTLLVFDRTGECIASYDKTHLFTPMGEQEYFTPGDHLCRFVLDGVSCAAVICYDIRFPELIRSLALQGRDLLFVVAQWPDKRLFHLETLVAARAIENQMFLALCNSCGRAGQTQYAGHSAILDPWGTALCRAGEQEETVSACCDFSVLQEIRSSINVFSDRRAELYKNETKKEEYFY